VNLAAPGPKPGSQSCNQAGDCETSSATRCSGTWRRRRRVQRAGRAPVFGVNLAYEGQTLNGEGMLVSGSYFPVLGVQPALGRLFGPADDETIGAHFVAVLATPTGSQRWVPIRT
jgi:hypothetical protein